MSAQATLDPPLEHARPRRPWRSSLSSPLSPSSLSSPASPARASTTIWSCAAILSCWLAAAGVFCTGPAWIGFLSDDFDLLTRAGTTPWLYPIEVHHYSPAIAALFKLTAQGVIGSSVWHLLALLAHGGNILLLWLVLVRSLSVARPYAWVVTMLFALGAPGYEAIAWASCLGYVLLETTVLAAVLLSLSATTRGEGLVRWGTLLLQLAALAIWDWGVLLLPIVAVCYWFRIHRVAGSAHGVSASAVRSALHRHGGDQSRGWLSVGRWMSPAVKLLSLLWPAAVAWTGVLLLKYCFGYAAGYHRSFDPIRYVYYFLSSPIRCLYPNGVADFYSSAAGLGLALLLFAFVAVRCRSDSRIPLLAGIFLFCQLPYVFMAAPTLRYYYVSSPFLFTAMVLAVAAWRSRAGKIGLLAAALCLHAGWAWQRARLYQGAYRESQAIGRAIAAIPRGDLRTPLVVVNLPDSYGPPGLMWGPNMWRNGMSAFQRDIIRVNTPGCAFDWLGSGIPKLSRDEILARYRGHDVYAVSYDAESDWRHFKVERWNVKPARTCRRPATSAANGNGTRMGREN